MLLGEVHKMGAFHLEHRKKRNNGAKFSSVTFKDFKLFTYFFLLFFSLRCTLSENCNTYLKQVIPSSVPLNKSVNISVIVDKVGFCQDFDLDIRITHVGGNKSIEYHPMREKMNGNFQIEASFILSAIDSFEPILITTSKHSSEDLFVVQVYEEPMVLSIFPTLIGARGGWMTIKGANSFYSTDASVLIEANWTLPENKTVALPALVPASTAAFPNLSFQFPILTPEDHGVDVLVAGKVPRTFQTQISLLPNGQDRSALKMALQIHPMVPLKIAFVFTCYLDHSCERAFHQHVALMEIETLYKGLVDTVMVDSISTSAKQWASLIGLCQQNYDLIFLDSNGWHWAAMETAATPQCNYLTLSNGSVSKVPKVTRLLSMDGPPPVIGKTSNSSLGVRLYEMRYLNGLIAGSVMKDLDSKKVGYIAIAKTPAALQSINSFTVGCREIEPNCSVVVLWISPGNGASAEVEKEAAEMLWVAEGCRILVQDTFSVQAMKVFVDGYGADSHGISVSNTTGFVFGPVGDARRLLGDQVLSGVMVNWTSIVKNVLAQLGQSGTPETLDIPWGGVQEGFVSLPDFSVFVDAPLREFVERRQYQMEQGDHRIFCGSLITSQGQMVPAIHPNGTFLPGGQGKPVYEHANGSACNIVGGSVPDDCCLSDSPGLEGMHYLLEGVVLMPELDHDLFHSDGWVVQHTKGPGGFTFAEYLFVQSMELSLIMACVEEKTTANAITLEIYGFTFAELVENCTCNIVWGASQNSTLTHRANLQLSSMELRACEGTTEGLWCFHHRLEGLLPNTEYFFHVLDKHDIYQSLSCSTLKERVLDMRANSVVQIFRTIFALLFVLNCCIFCVLTACRDSKIVKVLGLRFCQLHLVGLMMIMIGGISVIQEDKTTGSCQVWAWSTWAGFVLTLAPLCAKQRRLYNIHNNRKLRKARTKQRYVLMEVCAFLVIQMVLTTFACFYLKLSPSKLDHIYDDKYYHEQCMPKSHVRGDPNPKELFLYGFSAYVVRLPLYFYGTLMALKVRNLPAMFNESSKLATMMLNLVLTDLICIIIITCTSHSKTFQHPLIQISIMGFKLSWVVLICQIVLFFPVLYVLWSKEAMQSYLNSSDGNSSDIPNYSSQFSPNDFRNNFIPSVEVIELDPLDDLKKLEEELKTLKRKNKKIKQILIQAQNGSIPGMPAINVHECCGNISLESQTKRTRTDSSLGFVELGDPATLLESLSSKEEKQLVNLHPLDGELLHPLDGELKRKSRISISMPSFSSSRGPDNESERKFDEN